MSDFQISKPKPSWYNEKDVAIITGLSLSTLRKWRMLGINLPYHKLGKSVRYSKDDIIAFMASKVVPVR